MPNEKEIGVVMSYYTSINVAAIKLTSPLKIGDTIQIRGTTTDFTQKVNSMQINRKDVKAAKKGDEVGIKVTDRVRHNDRVFLV